MKWITIYNTKDEIFEAMEVAGTGCYVRNIIKNNTKTPDITMLWNAGVKINAKDDGTYEIVGL